MRALHAILSRSLHGAVCAALAAGGALAQAPIPTHQPGPYPVGFRHWDFGQVQVPEPGSGGSSTIQVQHYGIAYYPAAFDGEAAPFASGASFPFVVFGHGRFQAGPTLGSNHLQAAYLLEHLASWGFVVASVNLDVVGQYAQPTAIVQRGLLFHHTIDAFEQNLHDFMIDFGRIGVLGHSRGGEGAVQAWFRNDQGHAIGAVGTISPTAFLTREVEGTPYFGIYGSKDGDVNNGMPLRIYDRAFDTEKGFAYVEGANHFWFTEDINFSGEGSADITRALHHEIARTYLAYFLVQTIGRPVPQTFEELCDGPSLFPVTDQVAIHPMYASRSALVLNDFQDEPPDPLLNSLGGFSRGGNLTQWEEQSLAQAPSNLYHRTTGVALRYDAGAPTTPFYVEGLPAPTDASDFGYVSLRATQLLDSPENVAGQPQDFRVALIDADGDRAFVSLSDHGLLPWPITHSGAQFPEKSVMRTSRLPLSAFTAVNAALDLDRLQAVGLAFDLLPSADLRLDDVHLTD